MRVSPAFILLVVSLANYAASAMAAAEGAVQVTHGRTLKNGLRGPPSGTCDAVTVDAFVATYIWGQELINSGITPPAGVGSGYFQGPRLEYLVDRTKIHSGAWCWEDLRFYIPRVNDEFPRVYVVYPNTVAKANFGNAYGGFSGYMQNPEIDLYFLVFGPDGEKTDCVLKMYYDITAVGRYLVPKAFLRKESGCENLPNLQIFETGVWCSKKDDAQQCSNLSDKSLYKFGDTFMVYYDNKPYSAPAGFVGNETVSTDGSFVPQAGETVAPGPASSEEGSAPAAASSGALMKMPVLIFHTVVAVAGAIIAF